MHKNRYTKLKILLKKNMLDGLFITNPFNIYYLTKFKSLSYNYREITAYADFADITIFVPKLYQEEVKRLDMNKVIIENKQQFMEKPAIFFPKSKKVGFEANDLKFSEYLKLKKYSKARLIPTEGIINNLRIIKDSEEIKIMKTAVKITDSLFRHIKTEIKLGMTELQVANKIIEIIYSLGADGPSFNPIVASGANSALPHHITSHNKIKAGILLIDTGVRYKNYNSDLTRTFFIGKPTKKFIDVYNLVLKAQKTSINILKPGVSTRKPWNFATEILGKQSKFFTHAVGHGIGLEVHETPYLRKNKFDKLKKGMLVSTEPGIYYPGWGGIRIEDMCLITKSSRKILSKTPKKLEKVIINV